MGYPAAPPPSSSAYPAYGAPSGPVPDTPVRKQRSLGVVVVAAVTALVVSAGTFFGLSWLNGDSTSWSARPASVATIGQSSTETVPVDGSSLSQPDWDRVSDAVAKSVVVISVAIGRDQAQGSGVILSQEGDIITNNHVVEGAEDNSITVTLSDGRMYGATIIGTDRATDLAVVRITNPPDDLSPAALGDSSTVTVGQPVMALGIPLGMQNTATTGVVSAVNRPMPMGDTQRTADKNLVTNTIQVDASVNPGNSGGPLFDGQGKVIGINSSIITFQNSGSIGLGFAIPMYLVQDIASQLVNNSDHIARHAYLGVTMDDERTIAEVDGASRLGTTVLRVEDDSPASAAGLQAGDVIVAFNSSPLQDLSSTPTKLTVSQSLTAFVRSHKSGDGVVLTVVRDGQALDFDVALTSRPDE